jgi:NADPH:quinone reductase-like Zn-dependent oxidoreductase
LVICGATSGDNPTKAELTKIFFKPVRVIGSVMGTRDELISLAQMLVATGVRPQIYRILPLADAAAGFATMIAGVHFGKIIFEP